MSSCFEILDNSQLVSECRRGRIAVVRVEVEGGRKNGFSMCRFFRKAKNGSWLELPLALNWKSLWHRFMLAWPPEDVFYIKCDTDEIVAYFADEVGLTDLIVYVKEARFSFETKKWSIRLVFKLDYAMKSLVGDYWQKDGAQKAIVLERARATSLGFLSQEDKQVLNKCFGDGFPRFPWLFFK